MKDRRLLSGNSDIITYTTSVGKRAPTIILGPIFTKRVCIYVYSINYNALNKYNINFIFNIVIY
jgi:hypothetical protein